MPIVVSRATGEIISKPELTQADRDRAWEAVVRAFAKRHPELLVQQPAQNEAQAEGGARWTKAAAPAGTEKWRR